MNKATAHDQYSTCVEGGDISIWDSQNFPPRVALNMFCQRMRGAPDPWSDFHFASEFEGRSEGVSVGGGSIFRARSTPFHAIKTASDVARASAEYFYAFFVLSGEIGVEQSGRSSLATSGDLVVFDSAKPVKVSYREPGPCGRLMMKIPKARFSDVKNSEDRFNNIVISRERLASPLVKCVSYITENIHALSRDELNALFDASVALVPLSAGALAPKKDPLRDVPESSYLLQQILNFIDQEIANPGLTPGLAAQQFGISVRYVHYLFASMGVTFTSYTVERRLSNIRNDLLSAKGRGPEISSLAFRWGFNDLSTFYRAFNRRFGCTPGRLRKRGN